MTKGKGKNKSIFIGDKFRVDASVPLLKLLKENYRVSLLHMSINKMKEVEIDKIIPQSYVGYMYFPFSKQSKTFREQVEIFCVKV